MAASPSPEPLGAVKLVFSAAAAQVQKVPTIQALDALKQAGHDVTVTYLSQPQDAVTAVVRGDANFGSASASTVIAAIAQGNPIKAIAQANAADYVLVAPVDVTGIEGLNGLRVGIHAKVSTTTLLVNVALAAYPTVKPQILVVPGSANRIQALAAGQLDASPIQIGDVAKLDQLAPGKFHVIYDFAKEQPGLMDSALFTSDDVLKSDPTLVKQFLEAQLTAVRQDYADPTVLAAAITANVPKTTAEEGTSIAKLYVDEKVWPADGGMTADNVKLTLDALSKAGMVTNAPAPESVADRTGLDAALKALGQ